MTEKEYALMEGNAARAEDAYFDALPHLDGDATRRVFHSAYSYGFSKALDLVRQGKLKD